MKSAARVASAASVLFGCLSTGLSARLDASPVSKVVTLLTELRAGIVSDQQSEQKTYDQSACWCEETMARKATDIASAKDLIENGQEIQNKLKADLGALQAEVAQLKKDLSANQDAQREATQVREKEGSQYDSEKSEYEQSLGALEQAIRVLSGAGTGKKGGFLETMHQAQLISVAADVRQVLQSEVVARWAADKDLRSIELFLERPEDFAAGRRRLSALQVDGRKNPFGDYAPQSTQITGMLKSLYDAFVSDLEKANAAEAERQKTFQELVATKKVEDAELTASLLKAEEDQAAKAKLYADTKAARDNAAKQLKADEAFFAEAKASCQARATEWAERSRLRAEEIAGFDQALQVLDSPEAKAIFARATSFLQLSSGKAGNLALRQARAFATLRAVATAHGNVALAQIASETETGGHFDKVLPIIDQMVELIRKEEQDDIAHKKRCESEIAANNNAIEDLEHTLTKAGDELKRIQDKVTQVKNKVTELEADIKSTKSDMDSLLDIRNKERAAFEQGLKDDIAAVALIQQAIEALKAFYKKNNLPISFGQMHKEPTYTIDSDSMPKGPKKGYGGSGGSGGVISIMEAIVEDLNKEVKTARKEEEKAQKQYETDRQALAATLRTQEDSKVASERDLADLQSKAVSKEAFQTEKEDDLAAENERKATLQRDCEWVQTTFETRREQRKKELQGLAEAKSILAGVEAGDFDELELTTDEGQ